MRYVAMLKIIAIIQAMAPNIHFPARALSFGQGREGAFSIWAMFVPCLSFSYVEMCLRSIGRPDLFVGQQSIWRDLSKGARLYCVCLNA